jgi:hypothetical protein
MYRSPNACFNAAKVGSPVQCPGAMFYTLKVSLSAATAFAMTSSGATTRWIPPTIRWILGLMAAAVDRRVRAAHHKHKTVSELDLLAFSGRGEDFSDFVQPFGRRH